MCPRKAFSNDYKRFIGFGRWGLRLKALEVFARMFGCILSGFNHLFALTEGLAFLEGFL